MIHVKTLRVHSLCCTVDKDSPQLILSVECENMIGRKSYQSAITIIATSYVNADKPIRYLGVYVYIECRYMNLETSQRKVIRFYIHLVWSVVLCFGGVL